MYAIKTENLTKYYSKSSVGIKDVSLLVEQGDFFGFIGPNGAGKSTTIKILMGLLSKTQGEASVLGLDVEKDKKEILSRIGYMPSESVFYSGMSVLDVLRFSAGLRKMDCSAAAKELCDRFELPMKKKVNELSFGNKKKVSIICALQHGPELYIFDEPTSGLDPLMQREFYSILRERNEKGATVFLSSHVLSEVARYCKNAAIIRSGSILVNGAVSDLGHTGVKEVTLKGVPEDFSFEGARDLRRDGESVKFLYSAPAVKELLSSLSALQFEDITIEDPDLEDVFMHYYSRDNG